MSRDPGAADLLRELALRCAGAASCAASGATQVVPGEGCPGAAIVLVGEAPGEEEDRSGRPFVGRAGKLLDRLLERAGLLRGGLWITNAVKCRPTRREGDRLRNRPPSPAELAAWEECLEAELHAIAPRAVVALGGVAGRALAGRPVQIMKQRGEPFAERFGGAPALVTVHPSYLLRPIADREQVIESVVADLRLAAELARGDA